MFFFFNISHMKYIFHSAPHEKIEHFPKSFFKNVSHIKEKFFWNSFMPENVFTWFQTWTFFQFKKQMFSKELMREIFVCGEKIFRRKKNFWEFLLYVKSFRFFQKKILKQTNKKNISIKNIFTISEFTGAEHQLRYAFSWSSYRTYCSVTVKDVIRIQDTAVQSDFQ